MTYLQQGQINALGDLYISWNEKINVISRKDIDNLYEKHVLHSLTIAKYFQFDHGEKVMDVGTGGGFPGIPLAILFPETQFVLVDSIAKKVKVAQGVADELGLTNITCLHTRAEKVRGGFDFILARAVTRMKPLLQWVKPKINPRSRGEIFNGLICLKGGDLAEELEEAKHNYQLIDLKEDFEEEFFETKKIVYVPLS